MIKPTDLLARVGEQITITYRVDGDLLTAEGTISSKRVDGVFVVQSSNGEVWIPFRTIKAVLLGEALYAFETVLVKQKQKKPVSAQIARNRMLRGL